MEWLGRLATQNRRVGFFCFLRFAARPEGVRWCAGGAHVLSVMPAHVAPRATLFFGDSSRSFLFFAFCSNRRGSPEGADPLASLP